MMGVFGVDLSTGALDNFRKSASGLLGGIRQELRRSLICA
jgi:hypothetical protein